eukprot:3134653-Pleurochrysis_carterae.AAC.2
MAVPVAGVGADEAVSDAATTTVVRPAPMEAAYGSLRSPFGRAAATACCSAIARVSSCSCACRLRTSLSARLSSIASSTASHTCSRPPPPPRPPLPPRCARRAPFETWPLRAAAAHHQGQPAEEVPRGCSPAPHRCRVGAAAEADGW